MKHLFIAGATLALAACGGEYTVSGEPRVDVSGQVAVTVEFKMTELAEYFETVCATVKKSNSCYSPDVEECAQCMVAEFLARTP